MSIIRKKTMRMKSTIAVFIFVGYVEVTAEPADVEKTVSVFGRTAGLVTEVYVRKRAPA